MAWNGSLTSSTTARNQTETLPNIEERLLEAVRAGAPDLSPWVPLLATILGLTAEGTPETAALDDRFRKDRTHEVLIDFLTAARPGRTVFLFDNAQWMDSASGEFLEKLLQGLVAHPWLVAIARRPQADGFALDADTGTHIDLPPSTAPIYSNLLSKRLRVPHSPAPASSR